MTVTPSPQSVVVRRADLEEVRDLLLERIHGSNARSPAHNARLAVEAMLAAAPAGGEVTTLRTLLDNLVIAQSLSKEMRTHATDEARAYLYDTRLAALSPEAPARAGEDTARFRALVEEKLKVATRADHNDALFPMGPEEAALYHRTRADLLGWVLDMLPSDAPALTPRHEAPALVPDDVARLVIAARTVAFSGARPTREEIKALDTASEAFASRVPWEDEPDSHEAPAEGAGEALKPYLSLINSTPDLLSLLYDADMLPEQTVTMRGAVSVVAVCEAYQAGLRARSSAPEAREGEAS